MSIFPKVLDFASEERLAGRLAHLSSLSRFDSPDEPQSVTVAHSLAGMEDSFHAIFLKLVPSLLENTDTVSDVDVLHEIGEEIRHILYHIKDAEYYSYLLDDSSD